MDTRAIIPVYKNEAQFRKCLDALASSGVQDVDAIDNSVNNQYWTAACNIGLKKAKVFENRFSLFLNQDCYVRPDCIKNLERFMDAHLGCAIAGVKQVHSNDEDLIIHGGCTKAYPAGVHITGRKSKGDCAVSKQVPWVNGACMMIRMAAIDDIGLFDRNMKMIGSDSDICLTARSRGWEVWYCAEADAVHECGVTSHTPSPEMQEIFKADMAYWHDKWVGGDLYKRLMGVDA
jgi:O-antigen biosynthesis protein